MDPIVIDGGNRLSGTVVIQGSKNAVLPILAATLLIEEPCVLYGCPDILDVEHTLAIMRSMGTRIVCKDGQHIIWNRDLHPDKIPLMLMNKMRSSIIMAGALLGRFCEIEIGNPGGCVIGIRPIDFHLQAFEKMGILVEQREDTIALKRREITGCTHDLKIPSVGCTQNIILAAVLAKGKTVICGAAKEPEVVCLCRFLKRAGADIRGEGSTTIEITGVERLHGCSFYIPPDRIEAGTFMAAVLACEGNALLKNAPTDELNTVIDHAKKMGMYCKETEDGLVCIMHGRTKAVPYLQTDYYPGFPTDLQSLFMVPLALCDGDCTIRENIFENRFRIVPELRKMGADLTMENGEVFVHGVENLNGADINARELRGSAALLIAGLAAKGRTYLTGSHYLKRGYEHLCTKMNLLGAKIRY